MAHTMPRFVQFGALTIRDDGTWASDWIMDVLDDEPMPLTEDELLAFVRKDIDKDPALKGLANSATSGKTKHIDHCLAIADKLSKDNGAKAKTWVAKRNLKANP